MNLVENAKHILVGTGANWVMWLLIGLSIFSIAVMLERAYIYWARGGDIEDLRAKLANALRSGGFKEAREAMRQSSHPGAFVALRGMRREADETNPEEAEEAMGAEAIAQRNLLEARLSFLGTLGSNAPFIGLFGTVVGILQSFEAIAKSAKGPAEQAAQSAGQNAAVIGLLAEALVATAFGIFVAIPAVAAFNLFQRSMKTKLSGADILSKELLAYLHSDKVAPRDLRSANAEPAE